MAQKKAKQKRRTLADKKAERRRLLWVAGGCEPGEGYLPLRPAPTAEDRADAEREAGKLADEIRKSEEAARARRLAKWAERKAKAANA